MEYKQIIVLRKDLKMRYGKGVAQGAHAAIEALLMANNMDPYIAKHWQVNGHKKICVSCDSLEELNALYNQAVKAKLPHAYIVDSGLTEFKGKPTATAVAIGPAPAELIDKITGNLKLL